MKLDRREIAAAVVPGALLAALGFALGAALFAMLEEDTRAAAWTAIEERFALLVFGWLLLALALGSAARRAWQRWVAAPARLAEEAQTLLATDLQHELEESGSGETRALTRVINALVAQRTDLRADIAARVEEGSRGVEQERKRLATLMAELTQSVVVCNLDGRVLLYNSRARAQFRALSAAPTARGAELLGIGRSIYAVLDRALIAHALEAVQQRLQRGVAHPSTQFVTGTRGGQLLRVQLAPVRATDANDDEVPLAGFVLLLDNVTRDFAAESERDRLLHELTEGSRAALGSLKAAVEMLDLPDVDAETRSRLLEVVREEAGKLAERVQTVSTRSTQALKTRWPLEDMLGADLVATAARRISAVHGCTVDTDEVDATLWLRVDSYSLLQVLVHLAGRLVEEYGLKRIALRLAREGEHARLDLVWSGVAMSTETAMAWELEPIRAGGQSTPLTVRDVVERHDGEFWFERERVRHASLFRQLLPLARTAGSLDAAQLLHSDSRPEVYDFDLFQPTAQDAELASCRLVDLAYTVFDTETTGLDPGGGDEIIQIGAIRVVAGKLRREDSFEQLVDPQRSVPAASIPIHGIEPAALAGAPTIDEVLPAFHAYALDTVLVAHNASFDMRFFELKQERTGVVFDQPVLDTLLLSAVVHPQQESHRLEDIAARFGVPVLGRHTALGDALLTAEIFIRMLPLLAERGIHTLGAAREAARQSYYARLKY
jgi:DNA polymerase III subunit epsilon